MTSREDFNVPVCVQKKNKKRIFGYLDTLTHCRSPWRDEILMYWDLIKATEVLTKIKMFQFECAHLPLLPSISEISSEILTHFWISALRSTLRHQTKRRFPPSHRARYTVPGTSYLTPRTRRVPVSRVSFSFFLRERSHTVCDLAPSTKLCNLNLQCASYGIYPPKK